MAPFVLYQLTVFPLHDTVHGYLYDEVIGFSGYASVIPCAIIIASHSLLLLLPPTVACLSITTSFGKKPKVRLFLFPAPDVFVPV